MLPGGGPSHRVARARPTAVPVAVAVILVLLVVVVGGVLALGRGAFAPLAQAPPAAATPAPAPSSPLASASASTVVVRPGDTLWSIARQLRPTGDVRPLVDELVASHGSPVVAPGDRIPLPR